MIKSELLTVLVASFVVCVVSQATMSCTYTDGSTGYQYDLSPLANSSFDYYVEVYAGTDNITTTSYQIVLNVCRPIKDTSCSSQGGSNCDACQEWPIPNPKYSNALGTTQNTKFGAAQDISGEGEEGVTMYYGGFTTTMQINFICNPSAGTGRPGYVTKPTGTSYLLDWISKYGCATNEASKSRVHCDCQKADVTLCVDEACPTDVNDVCTYECFQFGGVENEANNYCNYNTTSDICN